MKYESPHLFIQKKLYYFHSGFGALQFLSMSQHVFYIMALLQLIQPFIGNCSLNDIQPSHCEPEGKGVSECIDSELRPGETKGVGKIPTKTR